MMRNDEPELAAFIYSNSLDIIEDYLVGPPRHPFYKPRGNFIIMATKKGQMDWMESGASILEVLWRDYRVFNVMIIVPCEDDQASNLHSIHWYFQWTIGTFDHFNVKHYSKPPKMCLRPSLNEAS